jgi:hypothetical protein
MKVFLLLSFALLSAYSVVISQDAENPLDPGAKPKRIYIGPAAGVNITGNGGSFSSLNGEQNCPQFTAGNAIGFYLGLTAEYMLGEDANSNSSIIARILYDNMPIFFTEAGADYPAQYPNGQVVNTSTSHDVQISYPMITTEIMYKINPFGNLFGFTVGPTFGIPIGGNQEERFNLVDPPEAQFIRDPNIDPANYINFDRTLIVYNDAIRNSNPFRLGLKIGAHLEISQGKMLIVPNVNYNFGITTVSSTDAWRINALQAGVDVRFAL